jgi:hypothetical protein
MGLLTNAKALAPAAKSTAKGTKHTVEMSGLEAYAQIDALIKALEGQKKTMGAEINAEALEEFMRLGANGVRPDSFTGFEGNATASVELRKRSTASVLTEDEVKELTKLGIPVETVTLQNELFGINPAYVEDMKLLTKVETALAGIVPEDFFFKQEKISKQVVSDESLVTAFAKKAGSAVIRMLTTSALKPKLAVTNMAAILLAVKPFLVEESDAEAATKALSK